MKSRTAPQRRSAWRWGAALALTLGMVLSTALSHASQAAPEAAPVRVQLIYERAASAASCSSAEQLMRDVEGRLGRSVFVEPARADLVARVQARRVARRFILEIELLDRAGQRLGQRELSSRAPHCSSLDDSLALVLALAVDAARAAAEAAPTRPGGTPLPGETPPPAPDPPPLETPLTIPASTHAPRVGWRWGPSLGVALASGLLPSAAAGLELGIELRPPHFWPLALRGTGWAEQSVAGPRPGRRTEYVARTIELGICPWTGPVLAVEATACAVQWLGRLDARATGFDESGSDGGWLVGVGLAPALSYRFGPVKASLAGTLLVPLVKRRYFFSYGADITLHEQPAVFGAGTLRVSAEF